MHRDPDPDTHPGGGDLLQRLQVDLVRLRRPAVLLRIGQAEQADLAEQGERSRGNRPAASSPAARGASSAWAISRTRDTSSAPSALGSNRSTTIVQCSSRVRFRAARTRRVHGVLPGRPTPRYSSSALCRQTRPTPSARQLRKPDPTEYPAKMDDDLHALGEDLITHAARMVRWAPKDSSIELSLAAARLLARLYDNGPTRISDLAIAERCSQPTITNHVKRLEAARLVQRSVDPKRRPGVDDQADRARPATAGPDARARSARAWSPTSTGCPSATSRPSATASRRCDG